MTTLTLDWQPEQTRILRETQNKKARKNRLTVEIPELLSTTHSDRVAVLDKTTNTYCAYSLIEDVNETGLTYQEAEDWIEGRLLIKKQKKAARMFIVACIVTASWVLAAYSLWSLFEAIF